MWGQTKDLNKCSWLRSLHKKTLEVCLLLPQYKEFKQHLNYLFLKSLKICTVKAWQYQVLVRMRSKQSSHARANVSTTLKICCAAAATRPNSFSPVHMPNRDGNTSTKHTWEGDSSFTQSGQTLETHVSVNRKTDTIKYMNLQKHHFANKSQYSQNFGLLSENWMWEMDHKEGWVLKNRCFRTVVLEKTRESLELQGNQTSQSQRKVKVVQSCPTFGDPIDCSLLGSSVHGILQIRILEWVAISFSRGSSQPRDRTQVSCTAEGFFTIWTTRAAQEHWNGQPTASPRDLPNPEMNWGVLNCRWILYQLSYRKAHILKEVNPKYSLEGLILKLKLPTL